MKTKGNQRASHVISLWRHLNDEYNACPYLYLCECRTVWLDTLSTVDFKWDDAVFIFDNKYKPRFEINDSQPTDRHCILGQAYWQTLYIGSGLL